MPEYLLLDKDIIADVRRHYAPELVKVDKVRVRIHLQDDRKLVEAALKDPLLHQRMVNAVQKLVTDDLAKLCAYQVGVADAKAKEGARANNPAQVTQAVQSVDRLLAETRSQIVPKIENAAAQVWRDLARTKKEYQTYQIKCGVKIASSVISTGLSIAAIVGTGGAALAIALFKAAKDASDLYDDLRLAADEAESTGKRVQKTLDTLATRFKDISAKRAVAFEAAHAVAKLVDTPEKAKALNDTFGSKLQGIEVKAHRTSEALHTVLEQAEKLEQTFASEPTPALGTKEGAAAASRIATRKARLGSLEKQVEQMLGRITSLVARAEAGQRQQKQYAIAITGFQKNTPTWVPGALKVFELVKDIGNPIGQGAGELITDTVLAIAGTYGDDVVDEAVKRFGPADKPVAAPPGSSISAPKLAGTSANLGAMKLKPLNPPPKA